MSLPREHLRRLFDVAVCAVSAEVCVPRHLPSADWRGRTCIIAAGKAAAAMTAVAVRQLGDRVSGMAVTRAQHGVAPAMIPASIDVIESGHPVPDEQSQAAARRAMQLAHSLGAEDRLIALLSGGGSALMSLPVAGVSLRDKQQLTKSLLRSGAPIAEINCVRKHLSQIKGGRLAAAAAPAAVHTLIISDIPGDDASLVASGPTLPDTSTLADARNILSRYRITAPASVIDALANPDNESPAANTSGLIHAEAMIVARARDAFDAAAVEARRHGYAVRFLGDDLQGEAREMGAVHATYAKQATEQSRPQVILSGGETTVTVRTEGGRGGRNLEYLLSLALTLDGAARISAIACDTDGIDGSEDNAGAIITPDTLARARALGLDARDYLNRNDSYSFFAALGDLIVTGPTRTNVNDFRAILVEQE